MTADDTPQTAAGRALLAAPWKLLPETSLGERVPLMADAILAIEAEAAAYAEDREHQLREALEASNAMLNEAISDDSRTTKWAREQRGRWNRQWARTNELLAASPAPAPRETALDVERLAEALIPVTRQLSGDAHWRLTTAGRIAAEYARLSASRQENSGE